MTLAMQASLPGGGGHPEHVVIAPDDIDRMMGAQQLDDVLRAGTAVKNIAENMKLIDRQPFDQIPRER